MRIKKVAILGAGTMGSQIAAHFANASIPSLLFDMPGLAKSGIDRLKKMDPAPLFDPSLTAFIEPLEFGPDFVRLKEADWVIEAIVEDVEAKRSLLKSISEHLNPDAIVTSNTSGLPLGSIATEMPDEFKNRWFGTHFFNPPRYLKLLELIPTPQTNEKLLHEIADLGDKRLGKGVVYAKDTPNFIANRLGTYAALLTLKVMLEEDYTIEEVDLLTGPIIGHPKTATFRLFDLVGIDILGMVARNLYENAPDDEERDVFKLPKFLEEVISRGWYGLKTGQGFYKKTADGILVLDPKTMNYRPQKKTVFPSIELIRSMEDPRERIANLIRSKDRAGTFIRKVIMPLLAYAANRIPEISDDIVNVDNSMKWGFNWSHGLFETWDAIGVRKSVERMREQGRRFPQWMDLMLAQPDPKFYRVEKGQSQHWDVFELEYRPIEKPVGILVLDDYKQRNRVIKKNSGASLIDIGDGVACLEFHSKMNAIGGDTIQMVKSAIEIVEKDFEGLVIGNQGENFSAGANLMLLLLEAQEENWDELYMVIKAFQQMVMSLRYSARPVVAAPFGLALGGGCEVSMGADAVNSSAEVYTGLVEIGVGLIPAGTGTKEIYIRNLSKCLPGADPFPYLRNAFETVALAKVSRSALEAKKLGYYADSDTFTMNSDRVIQDAKNVVLQLAKNYRQPQPRTDILLTGRAGYAYLQAGIYLMKEAGYISDYDQNLAEKIAWIMTGGDLTEPTRVSEQFMLDMEREAFLSLLGERKTQERIQHMLKTGKPLRN